MSLCASCGCQTGDNGICTFHHTVYGDDWAITNRIMCDLFHRGVVPPRLALEHRADETYGYAEIG